MCILMKGTWLQIHLDGLCVALNYHVPHLASNQSRALESRLALQSAWARATAVDVTSGYSKPIRMFPPLSVTCPPVKDWSLKWPGFAANVGLMPEEFTTVISLGILGG